jgi:hypothetical protein
LSSIYVGVLLDRDADDVALGVVVGCVLAKASAPINVELLVAREEALGELDVHLV